jgi:hypothetical protein
MMAEDLKWQAKKPLFYAAAEAGDLAKCMELVAEEPTLLTRYDIDGK